MRRSDRLSGDALSSSAHFVAPPRRHVLQGGDDLPDLRYACGRQARTIVILEAVEEAGLISTVVLLILAAQHHLRYIPPVSSRIA